MPPLLQLEYQVEDTSLFETNSANKKRNSSEHGLTCVAWNDCPFEPAKLAVGGYSKVARVYSLEKNTLKEVGPHLRVHHILLFFDGCIRLL
jgi:hypothetical protein